MTTTIARPGWATPTGGGRWRRHHARSAMCVGCLAVQAAANRRGTPAPMRRPVAWRYTDTEGETTDYCEPCSLDAGRQAKDKTTAPPRPPAPRCLVVRLADRRFDR